MALSSSYIHIQMEGQGSMRRAEATALFQVYDRAGVGEISKYALLSNFGMVDARINEEWLNKILLEHGTPLKPYITCEHFIQIFDALAAVSEHSSSDSEA